MCSNLLLDVSVQEVMMTPNQWYALLDSREVKVNRPVGVLRIGERLVFGRKAENEIVLCGMCAPTGERSVPGDHPIILYRRHREALITARNQ